MLNMSVAPQIKASAESAAALVNLDSAGTRESTAEEFGKILEREVSEVKDKPDRVNTKQEAVAEQQSGIAVATTDDDSKQISATGQDAGNSLVQTVLNDTNSAYKIDASLKPMDVGANLEMMTAALAVNTPVVALQSMPAIMQQQARALQDGEQVLGTAVPMVNQLLQQKLIQQNLEDSNLTSISTTLLQSFELENSAAYGKVLPLALDVRDVAVQSTMGDSFAVMQDEAVPAQSFGLNNTTSVSSLGTAIEKVHVDAPVGHAKWGGELAQKVVWMASQQSQVAEIHLNPAHLGPVEVMLSISQDQATAQFVSSHPAVRDAIQDALPRLREMLAESGIQLGNVTVGADSFQQENRQQQAYQSGKETSSMTGAHPDAAGTVETTAVSSRHHGIVNTYA